MSKETGNIKTELTVENGSIQLLACQIHFGYGGSDLDNWLEAEEVLRDKKAFSQEQVTMA